MNGRRLNEVLGLNAKHSLYRSDGKWYHNLTSFPGILFDSEGYIVFKDKNSYDTHPNLTHNANSLHVTPCISRLAGYILYTDEQRSIIAANF